MKKIFSFKAAVILLLLAIWLQVGGWGTIVDFSEATKYQALNVGKKDEEAAPWNGESGGGLGDAYRYENEQAAADLVASPPASAPSP